MSENTKTWTAYTKGEEEILFHGDNTAVFSGPDREANARKFAHVDELVEALRQAEAWFREYAASHAQKGDESKSKRNSDRADVLSAVLAKIRGDGNDQTPAPPQSSVSGR